MPKDLGQRGTLLTGRSRTRAESIVHGGLPGVALVTGATVGLCLAGAVIALLISLLY